VAVSCYDRAVALLAGRSHFRRELEAKLAQRGYAEDEVTEAMDRLAARGFLDDRRTAEQFVAERLARGPRGRARLVAELSRRGLDGDQARSVLDAALPEDDSAAAREAMAAWERRGGKDAAALARHLARKGFSGRAIVAVLHGRPDAPDELSEIGEIEE
jgi:regulatory protein